MRVAEFAVGIGADFTEFDKSLKGVPGRLKSASGSWDDLLLGAGKAAGVIAAIAGATIGLANSTANYAEEIGKASERTGLGTDFLQEMKFAASQLDFEFSAIQTSVIALSRRLLDAGKDGNETALAFKNIGVDVRDSNGQMRKMDNIFRDAITRLSSMSNETERNALATKLFGRQSAELIPLLNAGAGEIARLQAEAHKLGIVMSGEDIKAAKQFGDQMDVAQMQLASFGRDLGMIVIPLLQELKPIFDEAILPALRGFIGLIKETIGLWEKLPAPLREGLKIALMGPLALVQGLSSANAKLKETDGLLQMISPHVYNQAKAVHTLKGEYTELKFAEGVAQDLAKGWDKHAEALRESFPLLAQFADTMQRLQALSFGERMAANIAAMGEGMKVAAVELEAMTPLWQQVTQQWTSDINSWTFNLGEQIDATTTKLDLLMNSATQAMKGMMDSWAEGGKSFAEMGKDILKTIRKLIAGYIAEGVAGAVTRALTGTPFPFNLIAASIAAATATSLFNSLIPSFATGGLAFGPSLAMVGDNPNARTDPEVIAPLSRLTDIVGSGTRTIIVKGRLVGEGRHIVGVIEDQLEFEER